MFTIRILWILLETLFVTRVHYGTLKVIEDNLSRYVMYDTCNIRGKVYFNTCKTVFITYTNITYTYNGLYPIRALSADSLHAHTM